MIRNISAKCIDRNNPSDYVMHQVTYESQNDSGEWVSTTTELMATDPMDAIETIKRRTNK